ncbi:hypothetical protein ACUXZZ_29600 [Streptomyces graminifolii]
MVAFASPAPDSTDADQTYVPTPGLDERELAQADFVEVVDVV